MADKVLKHKMVILEEGTLAQMSLNATIAKEFPIFAPIAKIIRRGGVKAGCGSCNRGNQERAKVFQQVKVAIAGLASDRKRRLKDLANASQMRIVYRDSSGKAQQLTF